MTGAGRVAVALLTLCMALMPGAAPAQEPVVSTDGLLGSAALYVGDGVYVTVTGGRRLKGTVADLSATALTVVHGRDTSIFRSGDVRRIELQDTWLDGIGYGVAIGTGLVYAACRAYRVDDCGSELVAYAPPYMVIGGVLGGVVDASRHRTVYRATRSERAGVALLSQGLGVEIWAGW